MSQEVKQLRQTQNMRSPLRRRRWFQTGKIAEWLKVHGFSEVEVLAGA